jgi:hypothetical protein
LKEVIDEALRHRNTKIDDESKGEFVLVTDEFFKELQQGVYLSSKT